MKFHKATTKPTSVEGLVLDHEKRCPLQEIKVAVFNISEDGERMLVHEMVSDNNGYFSGTFLTDAATMIITSWADNFDLSGSYTARRAGERALACEMVKYGKNQFFTLTLQNRQSAKVAGAETKPFSLKETYQSFMRKVVALPVLRYLFS